MQDKRRAVHTGGHAECLGDPFDQLGLSSSELTLDGAKKAADAAAELLPDYVVVTSPNGAKSAGKADWSVLRGRIVIIWPDNDDEGRAYAAAVAKALRGLAASVKIVPLPVGIPEKWDAADALAEGWDSAKAAALIASAIPGAESVAPAARGTRRDRGSGGRSRQSDRLLDFLPECELWHSPDREAFATIPECRAFRPDRMTEWPGPVYRWTRG